VALSLPREQNQSKRKSRSEKMIGFAEEKKLKQKFSKKQFHNDADRKHDHNSETPIGNTGGVFGNNVLIVVVSILVSLV
jgi:hypothetical protein